MLEESLIHEPTGDGPTLAPAAECRVLWIECDSALRAQAAELITELGYRVTVVSDAFTAMGLIAHDIRAFDAVVVDLEQPGLGGLELARFLREARSDWPLVLCASEDECAWLSVWASEGTLPADSVLLKPVDCGDLEVALRKARAAHARAR